MNTTSEKRIFQFKTTKSNTMFLKTKLSIPKLTDFIRNSIAAVVEVDPSYLKDDMDLFEELGMDSMQLLQALNKVEEKYNVEFPEEEHPKLKTIQNWVKLFEHLIKEAKN